MEDIKRIEVRLSDYGVSCAVRGRQGQFFPADHKQGTPNAGVLFISKDTTPPKVFTDPSEIEQMLDDMPQNRCLYRDSGLWSIRDEGLNVVFYKQGVNETFHDFIKRAFDDDNVYKDAFADRAT